MRERTLGNYVGFSVFVLGVIIAIGISIGYDSTELEEAKTWFNTTEEQDTYIDILKAERNYAIAQGVIALATAGVVGTILIVLGNIQATLELIYLKNEVDVNDGYEYRVR